MTEEKNTPEDKLLKIIEKPKSQQGGGQEKNALGRKEKKIDIKKWLVKLKGARSGKFQWKAPCLNLRYAGRILIIMAVCLTVFFAIDFTKDALRLKERFASLSKPSAAKTENRKEKPSVKFNLAVSIKEARKRNIFTLTPETVAVKKKRITPQKHIDDLKLVGILWSDNPQAMIEDKKEKSTRFLNTGDTIDRWRVKEIQRDKVILVDEAREWELR